MRSANSLEDMLIEVMLVTTYTQTPSSRNKADKVWILNCRSNAYVVQYDNSVHYTVFGIAETRNESDVKRLEWKYDYPSTGANGRVWIDFQK